MLPKLKHAVYGKGTCLTISYLLYVHCFTIYTHIYVDTSLQPTPRNPAQLQSWTPVSQFNVLHFQHTALHKLSRLHLRFVRGLTSKGFHFRQACGFSCQCHSTTHGFRNQKGKRRSRETYRMPKFITSRINKYMTSYDSRWNLF